MTIKIVFSNTTFQHEYFWKHAESCSDSLESAELRSGILERDDRTVLGVAVYWVGGMLIFVNTLTSKSGIRDGR